MKWLVAGVLALVLAVVFWQVELRQAKFQVVETPPSHDESVNPSTQKVAIPMHHASPPAKSPDRE